MGLKKEAGRGELSNCMVFYGGRLVARSLLPVSFYVLFCLGSLGGYLARRKGQGRQKSIVHNNNMPLRFDHLDSQLETIDKRRKSLGMVIIGDLRNAFQLKNPRSNLRPLAIRR